MTLLLLATTPQPGLGGGFSRASQLLFHYRAEFDPHLSAVSRQANFVGASGLRPSSGWAIASNGKLVRIPNHIPRFDWFDLDADFLCERPALVVESADTNLQGFGDTLSSWTGSGTGSIAAGITLGDVVTSLVTDSGTGSTYLLSLASQTITGSTVHGYSIIAGKASSPAPSGWFVQVRDTTAAATRGQGGGYWNDDGTPNAITAQVGSLVGYRYLGTYLGVKFYQFLFATTALTNGNAHSMRVGAAATVAETGNVYIGGACLTDDIRPSSYIKTPANASVTRSAEAIGWLSPFVPMGATSQLLEFVEHGALGISGALLAAMTDKNGANPSFAITADATGVYKLTHHNGTTSVTSVALTAPAFGDLVKLHAIVYADGSVQLGQSVNGAATAYGTRSLANAFSSTLAFGADAPSAGWYLLPSAGFTKARTRLFTWKASAGVVAEADLAKLW